MCLLCEKAPRCPIGNFEEEKRSECVCSAKGSKMPNRDLRRERRFECPKTALRKDPKITSKRRSALIVSALRKGSKMPNGELRRRKRFEFVCSAKRHWASGGLRRRKTF